jgi:hypothetical protein
MQLPTKKAGTAFVLLAAALALAAPAGCFTLGVGLEPPLQELYYPTALLASPGGRALYVVNSDFDIQYTGGTVQAVDLASVRACVGELRRKLQDGDSASNACAHLKPPDADPGDSWVNDNPVIVPGPCKPIPVGCVDHSDCATPVACEEGGTESIPVLCTLPDNPDTVEVEGVVTGPLIKSSRVIGAFASSAALASSGDVSPTRTRLFVSVRGDPSVTYFETGDPDDPADSFRLECQPYGAGDPAIGGRCDAAARVGDSPEDSSRDITLPVEPVGLAAGDDGRTLVTAHMTSASASLLVNTWDGPPPTVDLAHTLGGLPDGPSDVAPIPTPALITAAGIEYRPGFLVSYRAARVVDILRSYDDSESTNGRHFLQRVASFSVLTNSDGSDSRGLAIDDSERKACETTCQSEQDACASACPCQDEESPACTDCLQPCGETRFTCLRACVGIPLGVFIANRSPASLLVGELETELIEQDGAITSATERLSLTDMVPLSAGPSRVVVGHALDGEGRKTSRVLAASYDSRYVVIYDPHLRRVEAAVRTGRGPQALAVDTAEDTIDANGAVVKGHALLYVAHFTDSYIGVVDLDTRHARTYGSMFAVLGKPTPPKESN